MSGKSASKLNPNGIRRRVLNPATNRIEDLLPRSVRRKTGYRFLSDIPVDERDKYKLDA